MNWKYSALRINFSLSTIPFILSSAVLIALVLGVSSCNTGSKGRYKFQSESMHWLQFRGPNASGIAPADADPPIHFSSDTNILWKTEILPGWSSPCIVNDRIFLTGFNKEDSLLYTFAISRENGDMLWIDSVQAGTLVDLHPINGYANPTVTSDGQKVFAEFSEYGMVAYDLDGRKAWVYRHDPIKWFYGGSCSPVILDSTIILIVNPDEDCRIVGLDPESGDSIWNIRATEDQSWSHFAIKSTPVFSNNLMLLHFSRNLVAYDMVTHEPAWWLRQQTIGPGTPVLKGDEVIVNIWIQMGEKSVNSLRYSYDELLDFYDGNRDSRLERGEIPDTILVYQRPETPELPLSSRRLNEDMILNVFDTDKDNAYSREEWDAMMEFMAPYMEPHGMIAMPVKGSGELKESDLNWKVTDNTPEVPSGLVVKDNVFFIKNGGIITVIDIASGEVVNTGRIGAAGAYLSSPMLAGNKIYTCSYNGTVSVLSAKDFSVLAHNKLKEKIGASPVAVDDVLYIRTDKHLYAFRDP